ncbi:lysylphosphatidylglycerol synthase domain-containing protein [Microbacterium sp. NPDC056569]|uniref:lysylphosphatidylglycerol synthase domain-containing protein n=1 Tax=Microbacterium sp. NPDC056569 TaxID=3345867 RepID=UPI00366D17CF
MAAALSRMPPRLRSAVRIVAALAVVAGTVAVVGVGPFVHGVASISPATILAAIALAAVATAAAAWRWRIVSAGFGLPLPWSEAFASYYRSQFLNTVLPGGVVGDVHRAYVHGQHHERVDLAARAVAAERVAGQFVQIALTLAILLPFGLASPLAPLAWISGAIAALAVASVGVVALTRRGRAALRREYRMLRPLLARPSALFAIAAASVVVVAAHATTFVVAGLAAGVHAGTSELAVVALIVLGAAAIPVSFGGWGPREAVAASAFALAGLGAGAGLAVSTAFGVLTVVAVLPGALALLADRFRSLHPRGIIGGRRSA